MESDFILLLNGIRIFLGLVEVLVLPLGRLCLWSERARTCMWGLVQRGPGPSVKPLQLLEAAGDLDPTVR